MDSAQKQWHKKAASNHFVGIIKDNVGEMGLFGLPFTETLTIENKLKTASYIIPQVGASWLF